MSFWSKLRKQPPKSATNFKRNDPCWCGSGKKYKKCHYESDLKYFSKQKVSCQTSG
jgi:uncharacterized protein YecA (UPF0149 family)